MFLLLAMGTARGQQIVVVRDAKSSEPVPFAHVCIESFGGNEKKYCLTSIEGKADIQPVGKSLIAISCMGYETFIDTIYPGGKEVSVSLKPRILNMDEVVITAQYTPERADKSIYKVNVINNRVIEQKGATTMAELLKDEVNMRVQQNGVLGTSLSIQGMGGENVKFLIDGVPLIGRMNGNIDLNQLSLYNVDHVEIVEGPMSVIYGSNALAGVVNIITKENRFSTFNTHGSFYTESVGIYNFDAGASLNLKKHIVSFDGGRNFFGGYSDGYDSRSETFKPRRQYFFDGYYIYSPSEKLKVKAAAQYFNELIQNKGPLLPPYYETAFDSWFTTTRYSARVDMTWRLPRSYSINALGSYSGYDRIKETYYMDLTSLSEVVTTNAEDQDTTRMDAWVGRVTLTRSNTERKFNYQTGIDINLESGEGKRILDTRQQIGDYAAFFSLKWDPLEVLSIQPGIRFIYNTKYEAPVVYALSGKWQIVKPVSFRISYSRGFRAPSVKELYLYFIDINHNIQGNPNLKAEQSHNFNAVIHYGTERKKSAWSAEGTFFYNIIDNIITLARTGSDLYTYINVDQYKTLGFQANAGFDYYPWLKIEAGLSETGRMNNFSEDADAVASEKFYYTTDINSTVSYKLVKADLMFSVNYKYTGKMPQFFLDNGTVTEGYIEPYHMMDATVIKGFLENRLRISAGVKNLFNVKSVPAVGASGGAHGGSGGESLSIGWGRTYFLKLAVNFNRMK